MVSKVLDEILHPGDEFSPIPFWFLNDRLEREELKRQLEDFCSKGVTAVVLHPRIGIPTEMPYLSDAYFDSVTYIVQTADSLGMKIVLYDEGMYPSGSAHGMVVASDPSFAPVGITLSDSTADGQVLASLESGKYLICKKTGGTIRGIHYGEDDGEAGAPLAADILNEKAVERFIELTHEQYYRRLHRYFGNTIIGFFTDEPSATGRTGKPFFPWGNGIGEALAANGGRIEELEGLFCGIDNPTTRLYREIVKDKLNTAYYKKLHDWCEAHGIWLMGHPAQSDDIEEERFFHVPGQDLVFRWVSPEAGGLEGKDSVMAKCSADAARYLGCRRNLNECFGVCSRDHIPWYFTASDMKWFIDWLGVRGVNLLIPHAFYYSVAGKRSMERPPDVGPNNIWWKHYRRFADYIKRVSCLMTDSVNGAEVAVLCRSGDLKPEQVKALYENQIEFNYLPYSMLDRCTVKDGRLCVGAYSYSHLIGENDLPVPTVRSVEELCQDRPYFLSVPQKNLRLTRLKKDGVLMFFAVNEGFERIRTELVAEADGIPFAVDLWSGRVFRTEFQTEGSRVRIPICLEPYESVLFVLDDETSVCGEIPPSGTEVSLHFQLQEEDSEHYTKTYIAEYEKTDDTAQDEFFEVSYSEMAECYVNEKFCSAEFFRRRFEIGDLLHKGKNTIRLVVSGSAANRYRAEKIDYGMMP